MGEKYGQLRLIGAHDGRHGAVKISQDVDLYTAILEPEDRIGYQISPERYAWVQVVRGIISLNGEELREGAGLQLTASKSLEIQTQIGAEVLLFDLA
ncbi:pirin family protein [Acaryochloris thomasi]|uniref:pirin family protein n=1 Tax=Acaryochloris thomasi TaxID=2929456 RepID=UPI001314BC6E|nr:hypothetical protein [Acaryochloris thomasi]